VRWRREAKKYGENSFPGKGNPKLTDEQSGDGQSQEKTEGHGDRARYPKKGDSHLLLGRQEKYRFIKHHRFKFPVGKMCKMFKVSKSGYYNWLDRGPSKRWLENEALRVAIHDIFKDSFGSYGAPRIREELLKRGYRASRPRVARIMRERTAGQKKEKIQGHHGQQTRLSDSTQYIGP